MIQSHELPFPVDAVSDTWLSSFFERLFQAEDAYKKYPTEQNKEAYELLLEIKNAMVLDISRIMKHYKETHGKS